MDWKANSDAEDIKISLKTKQGAKTIQNFLECMRHKLVIFGVNQKSWNKAYISRQ